MFPVIELAGTAAERGRRHGALARRQIERSIATYARLFAYCGLDWAGARRRAAGYRETIGAVDPDLAAEIEGIAAGSGRGVDEILALNARTEILPPSYPGDPQADWRRIAAANVAAGVPDWAECTAIAVRPSASATGGTLLAQNWDWLGAQRAALVLLRVTEPAGRAYLTLTEAGMLAKIGLNDRGLGVCLNILRSRDDGSRPGIPVHVLLRALLGCGSVAEAIDFASGLSFGASSNVLCADATGETAALEFSPRGLHVVRGAGATLCHTNHFLAPGAASAEATLAPSLSSVPRLKRAEAIAAASPGPIGIADLQRLLRDESDGFLSICRRPDPALAAEVRLESVASVIMELAAGRMHVAPGVPSLTDYVVVPIRERAKEMQ
jgi:isopenicillin-N N-acyltransferase-like protein